ncbi:MAG: hypothetical protein RLY66_576 [Candidatus Parcubacteria bacterium]
MKKIIIIQIVLTILLVALFFAYTRKTAGKQPTVTIVSDNSLVMDKSNNDNFTLVNPAVRVNLGKHYIINFKDLRESLVNIKDKRSQKTFIYFAYLNNSSWIGLDEKELFPAASTVKVPLAMALYHLQEQGKINLSQTYTLTDLDLDENFGDLYKVGTDQSLTVEELIGIMLKYSDNTAMKAVISAAELVGVDDPLKGVYSAMGWEYAEISSDKVTYIDINLKTLSNMFIALYNASYVNIEHSQKILNYLAETDFNDMVVAGVPEGITVSHKIGVNDLELAYSDCGIVYVPNRSYLMCAGSVGTTPEEAHKFIAEASRAVYEYVIKN